MQEVVGSVNYWMNLQDRYEIDTAARDKAEALRAIRPHEVA